MQAIEQGALEAGMAPTGSNTADPERSWPGDVAELFQDARAMHAAALARLGAGDIRDAAEKAWCATKRATDGLIAARTGTAPQKSPDTSRGLRDLATGDPGIGRLVGTYYTAQGALHGDCFYLGLCDPPDDTGRRIRRTIDYIDEAERLAAA